MCVRVCVCVSLSCLFVYTFSPLLCQTGRFIWLDGAHWSYEDWLPGEPNYTAGVENCLELLALGTSH